MILLREEQRSTSACACMCCYNVNTIHIITQFMGYVFMHLLHVHCTTKLLLVMCHSTAIMVIHLSKNHNYLALCILHVEPSANNLFCSNPDQATRMAFLKEIFDKDDCEKIKQTTKRMKNYPACKELTGICMHPAIAPPPPPLIPLDSDSATPMAITDFL